VLFTQLRPALEAVGARNEQRFLQRKRKRER